MEKEMNEQEYALIQEHIDKGFIDKNLEPIKCEKCDGTIFDDITMSIDAGHISEFRRDCKTCGHKGLGYWAYGHWQL